MRSQGAKQKIRGVDSVFPPGSFFFLVELEKLLRTHMEPTVQPSLDPEQFVRNYEARRAAYTPRRPDFSNPSIITEDHSEPDVTGVSGSEPGTPKAVASPFDGEVNTSVDATKNPFSPHFNPIGVPTSNFKPQLAGQPALPASQPAPSPESTPVTPVQRPPAATAPSAPLKPPSKSALFWSIVVSISILAFYLMHSAYTYGSRVEITRINIDRVTVVPANRMMEFLIQFETYNVFSRLKYGIGRSGTDVLSMVETATGIPMNPSNPTPVEEQAPASRMQSSVLNEEQECEDLNGDGVPDCDEVAVFEEMENARHGHLSLSRGRGPFAGRKGRDGSNPRGRVEPIRFGFFYDAEDNGGSINEDDYYSPTADTHDFDLTPAKRRMLGIGKDNIIRRREESYAEIVQKYQGGSGNQAPSSSSSGKPGTAVATGNSGADARFQNAFDPAYAQKAYQAALEALEARDRAQQQATQFAMVIKHMPTLASTDVCGIFNQYDPVKKIIKAKRGCWDIIDLMLTQEYAPEVYDRNRRVLASENKALAARVAQREGKAGMEPNKHRRGEGIPLAEHLRQNARSGDPFLSGSASDFYYDESMSNQCLCSQQLGFVEDFVFACDGNPQTCTLFIEPVVNKVTQTPTGAPVKYIESALEYHPRLEPRLRAATDQIYTFYDISKEDQYLSHPTVLNMTYYGLPSRRQMSKVMGEIFSWAYSAEHHLDSKVQSFKRAKKGESTSTLDWLFDKVRLQTYAELNKHETHREIVTERDEMHINRMKIGQQWLDSFNSISEVKRKAAEYSTGGGRGGGGGNSGTTGGAALIAPSGGQWMLFSKLDDIKNMFSFSQSATPIQHHSRRATSDDDDDDDDEDDDFKSETKEDIACKRFTRSFLSQRQVSQPNTTLISEAIDYGVTRKCMLSLFDWPKLVKHENVLISDFKAVCNAQCTRKSQLGKMRQLRHTVDSMEPGLDPEAQNRFDSIWTYHKRKLRSKGGFV